MRNCFLFGMSMAMLLLLPGCRKEDVELDLGDDQKDVVAVPLDDVAKLLSELKLDVSNVKEVFDAVSSSSWNGYDEEYMMCDLFKTPGTGVGDAVLPPKVLETKRVNMQASGVAVKSEDYLNPLKSLIENRVKERQSSAVTAITRADGGIVTAAQYLYALENSDIQIYWPYSDTWDGKTFPIITYNPNDGSTTNIGYQMTQTTTGDITVTEIVVDEDIAMKNPVWVVNQNNDSSHKSLELLRMQDPNWGTGGDIIVKPTRRAPANSKDEDDGKVKTLILKDFKMLRNYDPWFAGASEFFVKLGSVEDFTASTEAEMQVYVPAITDFMIVVKRKYVNQTIPFNAVLVSDWTEKLTDCALMIIEDDGGKRTSWKCSAVVKVNSKSYGIEIELPFNTKDDIVWRGQLSRKYILANNGVAGHFGDVDLTFEIVENEI